MRSTLLNKMFTQPVFLRKHGPELSAKLKDLGYRQSFLVTNGDAIATANNTFSLIRESMYDDPNPHRTWSIQGHRIDCRDNAPMFFALAALRDDSDMYQWFTDGDNEWHLCYLENHSTDMTGFFDGLHKATVDEIIKWFS